jgi:hypothetical protein
MKKILILALAILFASPAFSQKLPKHYPAEGFQRTGLVDAVYASEYRIVINDIQFHYSKAIVVHSMSSYRASFSRVRSGMRVAYKMGSNNEIVELWLLPATYTDSRRR